MTPATRFREASLGDGPALVAFFRETPLRAGMEFVLDRGPEFSALLELRGRWRTFVAEQGGTVIGSVTAICHDAWLGDAITTVGEVADLRVSPRARGGTTAARLLALALRAFKDADTDWVVCLIGDNNGAARSLVDGGAGLPALAPLARYASVHYPVWRVPGPRASGPVRVREAGPTDGDSLATLIARTMAGRSLIPRNRLQWPDESGSHRAWIASDDSGRDLAGLVVWDGHSVRRIRITRYAPSDGPIRGAMAVAAAFGAGVALPPAGESLRIWASRWIGSACDPLPGRRSPARVAIGGLVRAAMRAALQARQHVLQINVEQRDAVVRALPPLPHSRYWSTLYGVSLRGSRADQFATSICHADVALT
jgi:N-acetylglutamate synthase-like GNAT family acetyltransferase